jgi:hypothetical protein
VLGFLPREVASHPSSRSFFSLVARRDPDVAGPAIAAVTTVGYLGSVVGPPSVVGLAEPFGLRASFVLVPGSVLALVALTGGLHVTGIRFGDDARRVSDGPRHRCHGLGRALAGELAARGATVLLHRCSDARLEKTRRGIGKATAATGSARNRADFSSLDEVRRLAEEIERHHERLDLLVSNAGVGLGRPGSGRYFDGLHEARAHAQAYNEEGCRHLWQLSEELVGLPAGSRAVWRGGWRLEISTAV